MQEIWERIEKWLKANAPATLASLNSGASEHEIEELEALLSVKLPADMRESYLIHNGQNNACEFIDSRYFFSLEQIKADWLQWKGMFESGGYGENDGSAGLSDVEIREGWYNPKWIPLSNDAAANQNFLDLDPTEKGTAGQIILYLHDDSEITQFVAPGYKAWLESFADDLEFGLYAMPDDGDLVRVEYLEEDEYKKVKADKKSLLTKIKLPEETDRFYSGDIPFKSRKAFSEMTALLSPNAKKGKTEILILGGPKYKRKNAQQIIRQIKDALQTAGWSYESDEKQADTETFKLFHDNPLNHVVVGAFSTRNDALILGWVEAIR